MKRVLSPLLLLAVTAVGITSCEDKAVSTPELQFVTRFIRTSAEGVCDTIPVTDSLNMGDTVRWFMLANGVFNPLVSLVAQYDSAALNVAFEVDSTADTYLAAGSDATHGKLYFVPEKVVAWSGWMRFVTRKSGTHKIEMTVANEAGVAYSPRTWTYSAIVR